MWSPIVLCMLVGFAYASNTSAWKDNTEYVYQVRGRTLASLHEVYNQYSGILMRATLRIQPRPDGNLQAVISEPEYSQIHSQLENGWVTNIPDAELTWKPLEMSSKPFQVEIKRGVITDIVVNKNTPNWEANIIKGIMSQFQLNIGDYGNSSSQKLPALFKVFEDTVTGSTETLYEVKEVPEYMFETKPWQQRLIQMKGEGEIIEVVKHKNYTNNVELPSYFFGFGEMREWNSATNQMGGFFIRDSNTFAFLTGDRQRFTIHQSYTIDKTIINPTLTDKQKGSVVSMMNVTLEEVKSKTQTIEDVVEPVRLGNIVYTYEDPYSSHNQVRGKSSTDSKYQRSSYRPRRSSSEESIENSSGKQSSMFSFRRPRRSIDSSVRSAESGENYKQEQPQMTQAPASPLLPHTAGYEGKSVKKSMDVVKTVSDLAKEIGNELQNPRDTLKQDTISKFISMSSLMRIMSQEELLKVVSEVYTTSVEGIERGAWVAIRDAIAEAGTGPAFLVIEEMIESEKVKGLEASTMISSMTDSVRQPTFQYMKSYFEFIKKEKVRSQWPLNDTALLSFTELVSKVYFDEKYHKNQYPTKAFTEFRCDQGEQFIVQSVIPYLTQQLQEAISRAETHKIHAYIRALGNIGDPSIISTFEPYLEGQKQASQYQRLLMVVSMDRVAKTHPEQVRDVFFNIYQNPGETQEMRVAAVYRLMECRPTTDMLQLMATYTKVDNQEHVNAAVKSSIERLSELKADEFYHVRIAAAAARPLLTEKTYGVQFGGRYLYEHIIDKLNQQYVHTLKDYGSEDSYYPKGFEYVIKSNRNGLPTPFMNIRAYVTSLDDLIHVGREQTNGYEDKVAKQKHNAEEQKQYPWSSRNIAQLLNMESEISEQLEGSIYNMLPGSPLRMFSFDNKTIERLPEVIRQFHEEFKNGKKININKILNINDLTVAFPTEMGLPFIYTYDMPTIYQVKGDLKIVRSPDMAENGKIDKPDNMNIRSEMAITVTSKLQGRLGFITPFDHQQYIAGFDKQFQIHLPLHGTVDVDFKEGEIKSELEAVEEHDGSHIFHYSTWPYTSRVDILNVQPLSLQPNTHVIRNQKLRNFDQIIGQKQIGMAFRVRYDHERHSMETPVLSNLFYKHGVISGLMGFWNDASIQYSKFSITYLPKESSTKKAVMRFGYQNLYKEKPDEEQKSVHWRLLRESHDVDTLRTKIMNKIAEGIKNVKVEGVQASVELQGDKTNKYVFVAGYGKSVVDPKSRTMAYYKMTTDDPDDEPYELTFESNGYFANTNSLDLEFALEQHPKATNDLELSFGSFEERRTKLRAHFEYSRSEERKQYMKQLSMYQQCKDEMKEGNQQMPACANLTIAANLLDHTSVEIQYKNLERKYVDYVRTAFYTLRYNYLPAIETFKPRNSLDENQLVLKAHFHPDFKFVNITVGTHDQTTEFRDIAVAEWSKEMFVVHPVFHYPSRVMGQALELQTYRPMCVVDRTLANTFNNRTYPVELSKEWTVMLQYIPEVARRFENQGEAAEQLERQLENYVVLVRQSPESTDKKEVKIVLSTPQTDFVTTDITMTPIAQRTSGPRATVTIGQQPVEFSEKESYSYRDGYIQIYALPNGEVKFEVDGVFYIIYDGQRAKLTVLSGKFRDDVRGLCGRFNDYKIDDMTTPGDCIARDPAKFVKSFEVQSQEGKQVRQEFSEGKGCSRKQHLYSNVVPENVTQPMEKHSNACSTSQTIYVYENDEICFSTRPLLSCRSHCQKRGTVTKNVPVHCIRRGNVAQLWKIQIDKGASPDFSHKAEHKKIEMEVPHSCSA